MSDALDSLPALPVVPTGDDWRASRNNVRFFSRTPPEERRVEEALKAYNKSYGRYTRLEKKYLIPTKREKIKSAAEKEFNFAATLFREVKSALSAIPAAPRPFGLGIGSLASSQSTIDAGISAFESNRLGLPAHSSPRAPIFDPGPSVSPGSAGHHHPQA